MKHPNEATLALHAGGDLGAFTRWRVERHLANCESCRRELSGFASAREIVTALAEIPELPWSQMEAEMKANIRLGLSAGECVRGTAVKPASWFQIGGLHGARAALALATVLILVVSGLFLERARPRTAQDERVVLENTANGIQMSDGGQALSLMHTGAESVVVSVSAQGNMGARYVDPKTGLVTVNNLDLYAQ
jgi:hypothetical protein